MKLNGAQILVQSLMEQGVDTIFGYPGGAVLNIYDALYENRDRIKHITTAHEQGAAHAADGYARATGKTGVCLATSGPGATNLVTGIATAYMDSIPMVAITGNVSRDLIGRDSFQEVYIAGITMPITKHNFVVRDVTKISETIRRAFEIANSDRPGPVLVDIPKDVTTAVCEYHPAGRFQKRPSVALEKAGLATAAKLIGESQRPVLYFGGGIIASDASEILKKFLQKTNIPFCHSVMGIGVMESGHPQSLGMVGMHGTVTSAVAIEHSDLLLAVGARFSDRVATKIGHFAPSAKIIHMDIDPAEIDKNIAINYGIIGDAREALTYLYDKVEGKAYDGWYAQIAAWRQKYRLQPAATENALKPHQIMEVINRHIQPEDFVVTDVGQHQMWAAQFIKRSVPRTFITSGGLGTMGFGYGAAMGAKLGNPEKTVVHITGDGSFQMNLNEIVTSVSYGLPVITVLLNNSVLGMVRQQQRAFCGKRYIATEVVKKVDYVQMAQSFGALGYRCENVDELEQAFSEAVQAGRTAVLECVIDKEEFVLPMMPSGGTVDNIITAAP